MFTYCLEVLFQCECCEGAEVEFMIQFVVSTALIRSRPKGELHRMEKHVHKCHLAGINNPETSCVADVLTSEHWVLGAEEVQIHVR